jgi:hypothetical protein
MAIIKGNGPTFRVTTANNGDIVELGVGATGQVATLVIDFEPSLNWIGQFAVVGKSFGQAANPTASFKPVPYRLVNSANTAGRYEMLGGDTSLISDSACIQVPANGLSIALLVACSQGSMDINVYRMEGSSAV